MKNNFKMLIRESITGYKHIDLGNIKLAFTQVCNEEIFRGVYFAANTLYYVESGSAVIYSNDKETAIRKGEVILIRQHSKLDIRKFKDKNGKDFKSIIFYLFPGFVTEFTKNNKLLKKPSGIYKKDIIRLGKHRHLKQFCESLLPLFEDKGTNYTDLKDKTFLALDYLSQQNKKLLNFLSANSKPVKIDLYEFMLNVELNNYSVIELARLTGRSLSAFKRDFKEVFKTTPHQWLLTRKIDYAEQLLRTKKIKPVNLYFLLGFSELSHFSAAFKKIKGTSPAFL